MHWNSYISIVIFLYFIRIFNRIRWFVG